MKTALTEKTLMDYFESLIKIYDIDVFYNICQKSEDDSYAYVEFMFDRNFLGSRELEFITCLNARFLVSMTCVNNRILFNFIIPAVYDVFK